MAFGPPTPCAGFHGAVQANVRPGATVYVAGAGPVGLAAAASCQLLGAACVIVGDLIPERLAQARSFGCETIDVSGGFAAPATAYSRAVPSIRPPGVALGSPGR